MADAAAGGGGTEARPCSGADAAGGGGETEAHPSLECAICFEAIAETPTLPCACNVDYCLRCWDRCLAQSFNAIGHARCPTCRSPIRVGFDAEAGRLVFSREEAEEAPEEQAAPIRGVEAYNREVQRVMQARSEAIERLAREALPAQVRILEAYRDAHPALQDIAMDPAPQHFADLPAADLRRHIQVLRGSGSEAAVEGASETTGKLLEQLRSAAGNPAGLASYWAFAGGIAEAPKCVCGSSLQWVSGLDRARQFLKTRVSPESERFQEIFQRLVESGQCQCVCDLCDSQIPIETAVWTCESGGSTILHADSYDICDVCFARHVFGAQQTSPREQAAS